MRSAFEGNDTGCNNDDNNMTNWVDREHVLILMVKISS